MTDKEALRNVLAIYKGMGTELYNEYRDLGYKPQEAMAWAILTNFAEMSNEEFNRLLEGYK